MSKIKSYKIPKDERRKQSHKYIAYKIVDYLKKNDIKELAFSSTLNPKVMNSIYLDVLEEISKIVDQKISFINNSGFQINKTSDQVSTINDSNGKVVDLLSDERNKGGYIFAFVPPINVLKENIEFLGEIGKVVLFEKYGDTSYKNFEEELLYMKENQIEVCGIVTIK